jgi:plastocyanin
MRVRNLTVAVLVVGLLVAACSSSDSSQGGGGGATGSGVSGSGVSVTMEGFAFQPDALTLAAGKVTVTVTNKDSALHSFTLDDGSESQDVQPGTTEQVTIVVPSSGTLGWHCRYHPSMTGTITVG